MRESFQGRGIMSPGPGDTQSISCFALQNKIRDRLQEVGLSFDAFQRPAHMVMDHLKLCARSFQSIERGVSSFAGAGVFTRSLAKLFSG